MRTPILILTTISLLALALPVASAAPPEPQCLQVYPWSELCQGDVDGFLGAVLPCDVKDCVQVECLQVYPWSELCGGDVFGFVCYYVACELTA